MHLVTQSALLKALGWSLFDSLWQMGLLWLCYILLSSVFKRSSAHSRHGFAILLLSLGACWFLVSFLSLYAGAVNGDLANDRLHYIFPTGDHSSYVLLETGRRWISQLLPYCSFLYLLILVFLLSRYSRHYLHSRRLKLEGLFRIGPELRLFVAQTAGRMGIKKEVRVWLSSLVEIPVTLGFLRPVILVPFAMINNLSLTQVEAILLHELAHIKRYDYLLNLGVTILEILFFFNPFSRLMIRDIKREREHRCDDLVMQFQYDPHSYASALLSLATESRHRQVLTLAATGKNDRLLLQRVKRILKQKNPSDHPGTRPVVYLLFTLLAAFLALSQPLGSVAGLIQRRRVETVPSGVIKEPSAYRPHTTAVPPAGKERSAGNGQKDDDPLIASDGSVSPGAGQQDELQLPDDGQMTILSANNDEDDTATAETVASTEGSAQREYSIVETPLASAVSIPAPTPGSAAPFVPKSSFSSVYLEDTTQTGRHLTRLIYRVNSAKITQEKLLKELAANQSTIANVQASINISTGIIRNMNTTEGQPIHAQERELQNQLRSQRVGLRKQLELQRKLELAVKKLTIVYI